MCSCMRGECSGSFSKYSHPSSSSNGMPFSVFRFFLSSDGPVLGGVALIPGGAPPAVPRIPRVLTGHSSGEEERQLARAEKKRKLQIVRGRFVVRAEQLPEDTRAA